MPKVEIKESQHPKRAVCERPSSQGEPGGAGAISYTKSAAELLAFAKNYAKDSEFFLEHGKLVEAFEAAIIAWAYIDIGLKLGLLEVPASLREHFTVGG